MEVSHHLHDCIFATFQGRRGGKEGIPPVLIVSGEACEVGQGLFFVPCVPGSKLPLFPYKRDGHQPNSRGLYIPIIRIPIKRWDDHPQYCDF